MERNVPSRNTPRLRDAPAKRALLSRLPVQGGRCSGASRTHCRFLQKRGGATVWSVKAEGVRGPECAMLQHRVEDHQKLPHACHQRWLLRLPRRWQSPVKRPDRRIHLHRYHCGHVQHLSSPFFFPDRPATFQPPAVPVERHHPHQRRNLLSIELSQLGKPPKLWPSTPAPPPAHSSGSPSVPSASGPPSTS